MIFLIVKTIFFIYLNKIQLINILIKVIILKIKVCRSCKNPSLTKVYSLGKLTLTGIFPSKKNTKITKGDLSMVKNVNYYNWRIILMQTKCMEKIMATCLHLTNPWYYTLR